MLSSPQTQSIPSYCGSSEKVITLALQASIASSNLVSRTKSHTFYTPKARGTIHGMTLTCAMDDNPEIHEGLSASRMPCTLLTHAYMPVFTTWTHWWETTKPCQRQTKKRSLRVFFSPPFSYSASLCEQLLAGGSGETPAYSLLGILLNVWIYTVFSCLNICVLPFAQTLVRRGKSLDSLNICRITFYSNWNMRESRFEYMSYYLLFKLNCRMGVSSIVWIYVVLPFAQTLTTFLGLLPCLNICRIAFYSNSLPTIRMPEAFECMSYCLLLKLSMG